VPLVTAEDPREVITAHDSATGRVIAALKVYQDEWTDKRRAHVYLPGGLVYVFAQTGTGDSDWDLDAAASGQIEGMAGTDLVPVVRFKNRRGVGEYEPHLDLLDRIDNEVFRRIGIARIRRSVSGPRSACRMRTRTATRSTTPRFSRRTRARCGSSLRARQHVGVGDG
jgi:hypothetical protein